MSQDLSIDTLADRVNCYGLGRWLDALSDHAGIILRPPLGAGRERTVVSLVRLGLTITLFRRADDSLAEDDQIVYHRLAVDPQRAGLPFGLDGDILTPQMAAARLSDDAVGGRSIDRQRGDTRISYFLPQDARVVELTFRPAMVGITGCHVFRLGGEVPFNDLDRLFGAARLGHTGLGQRDA